MLKKIVGRALACASILPMAMTATSADAQQIRRIVAFGDSYADTGNAFALGYANPSALAVYPTGRFSGGSNYIDSLATILHVPVQNYAIGGAFGGSNNGTLCFDPFYAPGTSPLCGKGLQYEIDQFLNVGPQSAVFPNASTTLTRDDLLAISIGGNDARFYQQAGGTLAGAATAGTAAAAASTVQLNRLAALGNPTISFLGLNGATAPEVANNPGAQAIRGAYSTAYFSSIQQTLAGYAANGSIVHYLDGQLLLQQVAANPTAFGITNGLVCPAFPNTTCVANSTGYLFYGDGLHLTSQGFDLVGHYVAVQLDAPLTLQAPSNLGLDTARQWGRTLTTRGDLYGHAAREGLHLFAIGDGFSRDEGRSDQTSDYEVRGYGATVGAEYGLPSGMIGIAGNYSRPRIRFGNQSARDDDRTWQVGAYGSFDMGGFFGQGHVGYGHDKNRLSRAGVVQGMTASASGNHVTAGAKAGYLMSFAGLGIGPVVALDYAHAKVDGYTETGDPALTLNVGSQSLKSLAGQAGLEVRGSLSGLHPYADLTAEHEFAGNNGSIIFSQTDAPIIVNHWGVSRGKDTYGRLSGGASADIWSGLSVDAAFSRTLGLKGGQEMSAQVGLKANF